MFLINGLRLNVGVHTLTIGSVVDFFLPIAILNSIYIERFLFHFQCNYNKWIMVSLLFGKYNGMGYPSLSQIQPSEQL